MADQKRLELVLDPSKAQSGAKLAVQAVKSVGREADITANKVINISKAFDAVLSKLNAVNSKSPENIFKNLSTSMNQIVDANRKLQASLDALTQKLSGVDGQIKQGAQGLTNWERVLERAQDKTAMLTSEIGRQIVQEKQRHAELTKAIKLQGDSTKQLNTAELATKKLNDSIAFWEQRTKDLTDAKYKDLVATRESARQLEAYQKSLVDALSPAQKLAKAENELRKEMERGRIQLNLFEKGLSQNNIEQQESISLNKQLAQSQARLNQVYSKEYEQLVKNNAMIRKRKREIEELNGLTNRASSRGFGSGAAMVGGLLGAASGTLVAAELVRVADAYTNIQNRLAVVTDGTMDLSSATRELLNVSIESRTSLDTTMDVYAKMIRVTKDMTFANEDLLRITETVSKSVAMSGASVQGAEGALLQFSQALSGDFQAAAQELNSIIEQTPAVAQLMADALNSVQPELNATIGNLKRLATEGQFSTEMLLKGILNVSSAIDNQFANATRTVGQSLTALKDAFTVSFGEVDRALGGTNSLAEAIVELAVDLESLQSTLAGVATGVAIFAGAAGIAGLIAILNPLGLVIAGVAAVLGVLTGAATKYYVESQLIKKETEELTQRNKELKLSLEGLRDVYAEMSAQQLLDEFNKQQLAVLETQEEILNIRRRIEQETTYDAAGEFVRISQEGQNLLRQLDAMNQVLITQREKTDLVKDSLLEAYGGDVQAMLQGAWDKLRGIVSEQAKLAQNKRDVTGALGASKSLVEALEEELRVLKLSNAEQVQAMIYMEAYNNLKDKSLGGTREFIAEVMEQVEAYLELQGQIDGLTGSSGKASTATRDWASELESLHASLDPVYAANIQFEKSMEVLNKTLKTSDPLYKKLVKALEEVRDAAKKANDPLEQQAKVFQDIMKGLKEEQRQIGMTGRELYTYQKTLEYVNFTKESGIALDNARLRQIEDEAAKTFDLIQAEKDRVKSLKEQQQQMIDLRDTIADTFMDGFEAAMEGGDSFKDWFKNLLKELALMAVRNQIVIPIVGQFMDSLGLGSVSGGTSSSGGYGNIISTGKSIYDIYTGNNQIVNTVGGWLGFGGGAAATTTAGYSAFASALPSTAGYLGMGTGATTATSGLVGLGGTATSTAGASGAASSGLSAGWGAAGMAAAVVALPFVVSALDSYFGGDKSPEITLANMSDEIATLYRQDIANTEQARLDYQNDPLFQGENDVPNWNQYQTLSETQLGTMLGYSTGSMGDRFSETSVETPFGMLGVGRAAYMGETDLEGIKQFLNAVKNIDEDVARYLSVQQIESISESLAEWVYDGNGEGSTVQAEVGRQLRERLGIQLGAIDDELANFVSSVGEGLAQQNFERFSAEAQIATLALSIKDVVDIVELGADSFREMSVEGEHVSSTIIRTVNQMILVRDTVEMLGTDFSALGSGMLKASNNIIKFSGGIDAFNAAASSYYQNFYSEEERFAHFADNLKGVFSDLNLELPTTTEGFRNLVEGLDLTKESDQELYATLLRLNPQVKEYIDGLEQIGEVMSPLLQMLRQQADSDLQSVKDAISDQRDLIQDRYDSEKSRLEDLLEKAQIKYEAELELLKDQEDYIAGLARSLDLLRSVYQDMTMDTFQANQMRRQSAQALVQNALTTGITPSHETLEPALRTLQQPSQQYFSTFEEYARDFYTTKNMIGDLGNSAEQTLSVEEKMLKEAKGAAYQDVQFYQELLLDLEYWYNTENEKLDRQLEQAQSLYDLVTGAKVSLDEGFQSIVAAISSLQSSLSAFATANRSTSAIFGSVNINGGVLPTVNVPNDPLTQAYNDLFGRDPDVEGYQYWQQEMDRGIITLDNLEESLKRGAYGDDLAKIQGFADGGIHAGGWRIVGEEGPELEYTPPSRIYSNSDSQSLMDMSELVAEVRQLREDVRNGNYTVAKNTQRAAKILDRWDYDGQPEVRTV